MLEKVLKYGTDWRGFSNSVYNGVGGDIIQIKKMAS